MRGRPTTRADVSVLGLVALAMLLGGRSVAAPRLEGGFVALEQGRLHERNPYRRSPDGLIPGGQAGLLDPPIASDAAWTSSLEGRGDLAWSRQRAAVFGRWNRVDYDTEAALDHVAYRAGASLDLQTVGDSGLRANWQRQREPLEGQFRLDPVSGVRREQTVEQTGLALWWGLQRRWSMETGWQRDRLMPLQAVPGWLGFDQDSVRASFRWAGDGGARLNLARREVQGRQPGISGPLGVQPASSYTQGLWEVQVEHRPTPALDLSMRAGQGRGEREWEEAAFEASRPPSGQGVRSRSIELRWRPPSPWSASAQWGQDVGQQAQVWALSSDAGGLSTWGASNVRQARMAVQWGPMPRIRLSAAIERVDRNGTQSWGLRLSDDVLLQGLTQSTWQDRLDRRLLGLIWEGAHGLSLGCSIQHERKTYSAAAPKVANATDSALQWQDRAVRCTVRWRALRLGSAA